MHVEDMGIFDRMGRVISSNVNALLDKAEDPRKALDLIVEEMKNQIKAARKELVEGVAAEKVSAKEGRRPRRRRAKVGAARGAGAKGGR